MIFDRHAELKYRYGNRKFWCRGYYVADLLTLFEEYDPFTGQKNKRK